MARHRQTQAFDKDRGVMPPGCGETGTYEGDAEGIGLDTEEEVGLGAGRPPGATVAQENAGPGGETDATALPEEAGSRVDAVEKAANWPGD